MICVEDTRKIVSMHAMKKCQILSYLNLSLFYIAYQYYYYILELLHIYNKSDLTFPSSNCTPEINSNYIIIKILKVYNQLKFTFPSTIEKINL